jgi:Tfp pilus assembly protein PilF
MGKASRKKRNKNKVASAHKKLESAATTKASLLISSAAIHLIIIAVLGLIAYSNTFDVPFQWDDKHIIVENPIIKNFSYFASPSLAKEFKFYRTLRSRHVGFLTFALNYRMGRLDVAGYHVVNLAIHVFNAALVYFLVLLTFKTPFLGPGWKNNIAGSPVRTSLVALISALLFVSHPVQTQAVTYVVQRLASLATMFYLLSLVLFIKFRLRTSRFPSFLRREGEGGIERSEKSPSPRPPLLNPEGVGIKGGRGAPASMFLYGAAVLSCVLAMKTKEIAFTLPLAIALYEAMFFEGRIKRRLLLLAPILLTMLVIPLSFFNVDRPLGELIGDMGEAITIQNIPRFDYLLTEFRVITTYIRLLFLPVNQNLDYDYPVFHSIFDPQVFISFLLLLGILGLGVYFLVRSSEGSRTTATDVQRFTRHSSRLFAFGIFWFFLTLSVESSVIPLHVIYEHRVYLPSAGAFMALGSGVFLLMENLGKRAVRYAALLLAVTVLVLSTATYARNNVWRSEVSLWEDVVEKSHGKARAHNNLGRVYQQRKLAEKAMEHYQTAIRLNPDFYLAYANLGTVYSDKGLTDKAIEQYRMAIRLDPDFALAHYNLGTAYGSQGLTDKAIEHFQSALMLTPDYADAHYNLGLIYFKKGFIDRSRRELEEVLRLNPNDREARQRLQELNN